VFGHAHVVTDAGQTAKVTGWTVIDAMSRKRPGVKWEILAAALVANYGPEQPEPDEDA
jgi:hypothetical protein